MKLLFAHDHVFRREDGVFYSPGGLSDAVLSRYLGWFERVDVVARVRTRREQDSNLSPIANPKIRIVDGGSVWQLLPRVVGEVRASDAVIFRLPSRNGLVTWMVARVLRRPVLVELVGCPWDAYKKHSFKGYVLAPFFFWATRVVVRRARFVLYVTSGFLQRRYPTRGVSIACSDVAIAPGRPTILDLRLERIRTGSERTSVHLCTVGAVDVRYKGHEYVLRAQAQLKGLGVRTEYVIVGPGETKRLADLAERLGVGDQVRFVGSLPREEVFRVIEDCDVYIQPSEVEGLPRALIEAMSLGCPALGSRVGGIPELLPRGDTFRSGDVGELVNLLRGLDASSLKYRALQNWEVTRTRFSPETLDERRGTFMERFRRHAECPDT